VFGCKTRYYAGQAGNYFMWSSTTVFENELLLQLTDQLIFSGGSFSGFVSTVNSAIKRQPSSHAQSFLNEKLLVATWFTFATIHMLSVGIVASVPWSPHGGDQFMEDTCKLVLLRFMQLWLFGHRCPGCSNRALIIDGNQKLFTRLCRWKEDGYIHNGFLDASLLVGCTHEAAPRQGYCSFHMRTRSVTSFSYVLLVFYRNFWIWGVEAEASPTLWTGAAKEAYRFLHALFQASTDMLSLVKYFFTYQTHIRCNGIGRATARRVQQGTVQYKIAWSDKDTMWLNAVDLPSAFVTAGDSMHGVLKKSKQSQLANTSAGLAAIADATSLAPDEIAQMCNTQKDFGGERRRAAGWLFAARSCQVIVYLAPLFLSESLPSVYFILADIVQNIFEWLHLDLETMSEPQVKQFLRDWLSILVYDNGCSLWRYLRHAKRSSRTPTARLLAQVTVCVDAFHFRGHKGCKAEGSSPLPAVWPSTNQELLVGVDAEACEHIFAYMRRHVLTARCFGPWRHRVHLPNSSLPQPHIGHCRGKPHVQTWPPPVQ